jgi:MFS family permease
VSVVQRSFITHFVLLSVIGGTSIGLGKVVTTFFAVHLGASSSQVGWISAMEALGRLLVTLPAGFIIARFGAKTVYFFSSLLPFVLNLLMPFLTIWYVIAIMRGVIGLAIPFRIVSMNSSFLAQLNNIGIKKAGWYRGSQSFGMALIGPLLGGLLVAHTNYIFCYVFIAALFGAMAFYSQTVLPDAEIADAKKDHKDSDAEGGMGKQVLALLANREIRDSCFVEFVASCITSVFATYILLLGMREGHLSEQQAVLLMTVQGITVVLTSFGLGGVLQRYSRGLTQVASLLLALVGLLLLGTSFTAIGLTIGTIALCAGSSLINMVRTLQLSQLNVSKSKISALYNLGNMSGALFGALVGGLLADFIGLRVLFLMWIPVLMATGIFCAVRERQGAAA